MGEGDLTLQVEGDYRGALGRMKESINLSQRNLAQIVANVREISSQVKVGSNSVSEGSARLADRTAEQAASLEQTAASMEEISSTVNMSADSAQLANRLAEETVGQVMKGGEVIGRAIEAMDGINESSNKIVEIIALIDGIAFQTNLLALNAAVEAARAGEHGRGFGVVAGEVRGLAQRSADAAKDIRNLIEDSTNRVESGTRLVTESGEALGTVKEGIQKINDLISEIAAAAKEQTSGVEQINQAISSLDSNTQENSAMVEETTSSSKTLTELAQQLDEMVVSFKIAADVQAELEVVKRAPNPPSRTAKRSPPTASRSRPTAPPRAPQKDGEWSDF